MPRERRDWEPGDVLSVVGRAHEGRAIFAMDEDRRFFEDRLRRVFVPKDVDLLAWALLVNHYHLLIRVTDEAPGTLFLKLNTVLAQRERRRRGDHGAVFQDRPWTGRCESQGSVLSRLTYVLGNPIHHHVVADCGELESYPWTAYPEVLGPESRGLVDARKTLALLHPNEATARELLREAMALRAAQWRAARAGVDLCEDPGCRGSADACELVHPELSRRRRKTDDPSTRPRPGSGPRISSLLDERSDRRRRLELAGRRPADLLAPVCARFGADLLAVTRGGRQRPESMARSLIAYVLCDGAGVPVADAAALLGVGGPAATAARRRGRALAAAHGWSVDDVLAWPAEGVHDAPRT